jgi:hypothetical protein
MGRRPNNWLQARPGSRFALQWDAIAPACLSRAVSFKGMLPRLMPFLMVTALLLIGCGEEPRDGFHRSGSRDLSKEEAQAIRVAKAHLEKAERKRIDARYRVTPVPEGYSVHVKFVAGYEHGQPLFLPGGFCVVLVSKDWAVVKVMPGA